MLPIPAGKAVLFSPINSECSYAEFPNLKTEADFELVPRLQEDHVTSMQVTVDGVTVRDLDKYQVQSPLIRFVFPKNNVVGVPARTDSRDIRWSLGFLTATRSWQDTIFTLQELLRMLLLQESKTIPRMKQHTT